MSLKDSFMSVVKKYGGVARLVTTTVLNVIAPGSSALVQLVEQVFDKGKDVAQNHWEATLLEATRTNADELQRLGSLFDLLNGELAFAVNEQSTNIEEIVRQALATDATLRAGLRKLDTLVNDFACVKAQQRQLLDGNDEMLPIMRRLQSVLPFLEECQRAQADPREMLMHRQAILLNIKNTDLRFKLRIDHPDDHGFSRVSPPPNLSTATWPMRSDQIWALGFFASKGVAACMPSSPSA